LYIFIVHRDINCISPFRVLPINHGSSIKIRNEYRKSIKSLFENNGRSVTYSINKDDSLEETSFPIIDLLELRDSSSKSQYNSYLTDLSKFLPYPIQTKQRSIDEIDLMENYNENETSKAILHLFEKYKQQECSPGSSYRISSGSEPFVKITLLRNIFLLGDNIEGTMIFLSNLICYQVSIF